MKDWKLEKLRRITSALFEGVKGCRSSICPFKKELEQEWLPANPCDCLQIVQDIRREVDREFNKEGL